MRVLLEPLALIRIRPESRSQKLDEVWTCRLLALQILKTELPGNYHLAIAEAALAIGSKLFQIGARQSAREAFELARELGPPHFASQMSLYRQVARTLGPEAAEWVGLLYRSAVPDVLRKWVRARGK